MQPNLLALSCLLLCLAWLCLCCCFCSRLARLSVLASLPPPCLPPRPAFENPEPDRVRASAPQESGGPKLEARTVWEGGGDSGGGGGSGEVVGFKKRKIKGGGGRRQRKRLDADS